MKKGKRFAACVAAAFCSMYMTIPVHAGLQGSKIVTGTQKLIGDATVAGMIIAPIAAIAAIIYFAIRRSFADEMGQKEWNKRITVAIVSCIIAVLASVIINVAVSYYQ